jgi:hypothetical protein
VCSSDLLVLLPIPYFLLASFICSLWHTQLPRGPAAAGVAQENRGLVLVQLAAAAGKDWPSAGETCALLLAFASRRASDSEAARQHAENDRGVSSARMVSEPGQKTYERSKAIERRSVSGEEDWDGQNPHRGPQNGQNEPHYQPQEARATCR